MRQTSIFFFVVFISVSSSSQNLKEDWNISLTREQAVKLSRLPLKCMQKEYPNKLSQTLADPGELTNPKILHPAFYGCFDWHSSVHGHWMLVKLLKMFPGMENESGIRAKLSENITARNIREEVNYLLKPHEKSWERTYGWAWLLKLSEELHTWDDPQARDLESNLQPLTQAIVRLYLDFLPKLNYPIRVGEHTNTAFGLSFAWDYANTTGQDSLKQMIERRARDFYFSDKECPFNWEPGGYDFFSPCLEEADLMRRILQPKEFQKWLKQFLPQLSGKGFNLEVARVSDRSDGKLVHLDGLNFSRARCLKGIARDMNGYGHLNKIASVHIRYSLPSVTDGNYEGEHWLATFALLALTAGNN